jgi:hypothetical protein
LIRIERIITGSEARDMFVCSHCAGTWPVHAAGTKVA